MTIFLKRLIVRALVRACDIIDRLPAFHRSDDGWEFYRKGCLGCYPLGLAQKSCDLDERWQTGIWS